MAALLGHSHQETGSNRSAQPKGLRQSSTLQKYRAVIDGGYPEDELVGQRRGKVEPAVWRRRRSHSPAAPRCLRTARYGRIARDLRRTGEVPGGTGISELISASEVVSEAAPVDGRLCSTTSAGKSRVTGQPAAEVGRGRQPAKTVGKKQETR
jgi:hypothetical protein